LYLESPYLFLNPLHFCSYLPHSFFIVDRSLDIPTNRLYLLSGGSIAPKDLRQLEQ
jgi:hypothetical protein